MFLIRIRLKFFVKNYQQLNFRSFFKATYMTLSSSSLLQTNNFSVLENAIANCENFFKLFRLN